MTIRSVRGVHDILPGEAPAWQRLEAAARCVFEAYGHREIHRPIFERTELFARGIGEVTDIVQKEMYTFEDRTGESLTLRPEATALLLRAYIEHGLRVQPKPVRLYTMGPMFRYERRQAGRHRQFHQINAGRAPRTISARPRWYGSSPWRGPCARGVPVDLAYGQRRLRGERERGEATAREMKSGGDRSSCALRGSRPVAWPPLGTTSRP